MILCPVSQFHRYTSLHPALPAVQAFLANLGQDDLPEGRRDLQGDDLYISSSPHARKRPASEALLEAHRAYIDVQVILEGSDTMGWAPLDACRNVSVPYDAIKDIVFFNDHAENTITVQAGQLVVFFPEDAHAPLIGDKGTVKKLVVKVRV
jgi:biofilm protein TabA